MEYNTEQEEFWAGEFGTQYIGRNDNQDIVSSNLSFFSKALKQAGSISSCIEFGANIGLNLKALKLLYPHVLLKGIEINTDASKVLAELIGKQNVFEGSILDYRPSTFPIAELSLIKTVLIHINPNKLSEVYEKLYESTNRFILVCEYYNPTPVTITYRGHSDRLFKRDFAGDLMEKYSDLVLLDYGFAYKRDIAFPQDDVTWFLLEKGRRKNN